MYNYKCNGCNIVFKSMNTIDECVACHSKQISVISDNSESKARTASLNDSKVSMGRAADPSLQRTPNHSYDYKYVYQCNSCKIQFSSTGLASLCTSCLSSDIKQLNENNSIVTTTYTCSSCNYEFTYTGNGKVDKCQRCSSSNIQPSDSVYEPIENTPAGGGNKPGSNNPSNSNQNGNNNSNNNIGESNPSNSNGGGSKPSTNNNGGGGLTNPGVDKDNGGTQSRPNTGGNNSNNSNFDSNDSSNSNNNSDTGTNIDSSDDISLGGGDAASQVASFFEKFYTTSEDELDVINAFENQDSGSLTNSIYGGQWGVFDDGENINEAELVNTFQAMEDTSGEITEDVYMDENIFGLPLYYNAYADPCKSVFNESIQYDLPVVSFIPGKPRINRKLINTSGNKIVDLDEYYEKSSGDTEGPGFTFGVLNPKNENDMRYLSFKDNFGEYWKYAQFLTSYVHNWLIASQSENHKIQAYNFNATLKDKKTGKFGLTFYADRSTSVSEAASNSYGSSRVSEMVNERSTTTREASMVGKYNSFQELTTSIAETIGSGIEGTMSGIESLKSFEGILTKTANSLMKVVNGAQLDFPELWQDSRFDRSYSVSFRFYSPYGDRASIEKFVYTPFLALLALVLPRQDQAFSYVEPFLVRVNSPGWFNVDCGVITSMTINKGGSDNLWTADGLPRLMEVTVDIQDLYPMMKQLSKGSMTKYNKGLCSYLENLSGIRAEDLTVGTMAAMKINKITNSLLVTMDNNIRNWWDSWGWDGYKWNDYIKNLLAR